MGASACRGYSDASVPLCFRGLTRRLANCSPVGTPLPRVPHKQLTREEVCPGTGGRLVIVGDVHGCAAELQRLLEKADFTQQRDTLVLVGDLVNKGPSSGDVVRLARRLGALAVRGNHDDQLLEAWYRVGRYADGLSRYKEDALYQVTSADIRWLQELPLSLSFPWLSLLVVHAGLVPGVKLEHQRFRDLLWLRDLVRDNGGEWQGLATSVAGSSAWAGVWSGPEHVIFGHDAKRKLQEAPFATGLDTGCCYGYELSALVVDPDSFETRSLVQVPAAKVYSAPTSKDVG